MGVPPSAWISAFKKVNLHPKHRMPLDVWLSKIFSHITVSAGALTDDPLGPAYLDTISVPKFYNKLSDNEKTQLMELTAPPYDWSVSGTSTFPPTLQSLLSTSTNLHDLFKFHNEMAAAVDLGLALDSDLTPASCIARLSEDAFVDRATAQQRALLQNLDYVRTIPHLKDAYDSFFNPSGEKTERHASSSVQQGIGRMLEDSVTPQGRGSRPTHKHNILGEPEGVACIVNTPARVLKLRQEANLRTFMTETATAKAKLKETKAEAKQQKTARTAAARAKEDELWCLLVSAGFAEAPSHFEKRPNVTVARLKGYLKDQGVLKFAPKTGGKPALVKFVEETCASMVGLFDTLTHKHILTHNPSAGSGGGTERQDGRRESKGFSHGGGRGRGS